ncbi:hypothetical protein GA0004736_3402 [Curtobacterium sp. 9128]|nr:hypothetical protein [Curtobacterium sp. 9128]SBN64442.1 hypothetical protein GA0004736_3402 [Curtobacterium sp. 9128]
MTTDDPDLTAHRTRSNVHRPTPHPDTVAEIEQVMDDVKQDRGEA